MTSPERIGCPPPSRPAALALWWGARKGGRRGGGVAGAGEPLRVENAEHLETRLLVERRQDARETTREHRLARARRSPEQQAMPSGRGDLERSLRERLATHLAQAGRAVVRRGPRRRLRRRTGERIATHQMIEHLAERVGAEHADARRVPGEGEGVPRYDDLLHTGVPQRQDRGERAARRAQSAVERELAEEASPREPLGVEGVAGRGQDRDGDREVEPRALLAQLRRGEIHGHAPIREGQARGGDRAADPRRALAHGGLGQPDDVDPRQL